MTVTTYGDIHVSTPKAATRIATKAAPKKSAVTEAARHGFFARFLGAILESRMRHAERDIALYAPKILPLLPAWRREEARARVNASGSDGPRGGK